MCVRINGIGNPLLLTFKLVRESRLRPGTSIPNLGTLRFWILELFAIYVHYGRTDRWTKATLIAPFPAGSVCGPLLFILYTAVLFNIIAGHGSSFNVLCSAWTTSVSGWREIG